MFIGMAVVVAGLAGFFVWERYWGNAEYQEYKALERRYIEAMTNDTYGGQTPQETLDLFVAALKAEDVELAAKYFMLDDNLSREKWVKTLWLFKEKELLNDIVKDIKEKAKEDLKNKIDENDFKFNIYDSTGKVAGWIDMRFNKYSKVWKIESL